MKDISKKDILIRFFYMFLFFAIVGWIYEMVLFFVYGNDPYNRGFLFGPYLPIYGFGAILLIALLGKLVKTKKIWAVISVFLAVVLITTLLELGVSYILEFFKIEPLWDYTNFKYNFQGRISLQHSIRFGFGGLLFLYVLTPFFDFLLNKIPVKIKSITAILLFSMLVIDFAITMVYS